MKFWIMTLSSPRGSADIAARAEQAGWYGMMVVDSQNLSGDSYVSLTMAATGSSTLRLGTGVTNSVTRHAAVTAAAIASVNRVSNGRAVLGIGRGDSALAHLGRSPATLKSFERYVRHLKAYLSGDVVAFDECGISSDVAPPVDELELADAPRESGINWLRPDDRVPIEVASTGPKVISIAARHADRIMLTVGANKERVRWGMETARQAAQSAARDPDRLKFGAYVNLICSKDKEAALKLARGGTSLFARFSVMHGDVIGPTNDKSRDVLNEIHERYNMNEHGRADGSQTKAVTDEFIDEFSIVGDPDHCIERLQALHDLGINTFVINGLGYDTLSPEAKEAASLFEREVLAPLGD